MNTLAALASLAPYGLAPAAGLYGAYRGARSVMKPRYKSKRRIPRSLKVKGLHSFRRSVNSGITYIPATGFNAGALNGFSMTMTFSLTELRVYLGASSFTVAVPGSTDFTNLFDAWRIKGVRVNVFFQNTTSPSTGITTNMPLLVYVWDKEDKSIDTVGTLNQFESVKRFQFGNGAARGGALTTYGRPHASSTGIVTNAGSGGLKVEPVSTWLDTAQPNVEYQSLKLTVDNFLATQATAEGSFSFYVDIFYEMKDVI